MAETETEAEAKAEAEIEVEKAKRPRSPSYPYFGLSECLGLLEKMHEAARGVQVRLPDLKGPWGLKSSTGSLLRYVAALSQFGLVDSSGSGISRKIKVSDRGLRILQDEREGVRDVLMSEAALSSPIISEVFNGSERIGGWGRRRPSDGIAQSELVFELHFTKEAANRFLHVYDETVRHIIGPGEEGKDVDTESDVSVESPPLEEESKEADMQTSENTETAPAAPIEPATLATNDIRFKSEGDGLISIMATLDAEGLDDLEKKIAAFKLLLN